MAQIACGNSKVHGKGWSVQHHHHTVLEVKVCHSLLGGLLSIEEMVQDERTRASWCVCGQQDHLTTCPDNVEVRKALRMQRMEGLLAGGDPVRWTDYAEYLEQKAEVA